MRQEEAEEIARRTLGRRVYLEPSPLQTFSEDIEDRAKAGDVIKADEAVRDLFRAAGFLIVPADLAGLAARAIRPLAGPGWLRVAQAKGWEG